MSKNITGDNMNEINRTKEIAYNSRPDDLSNRSLNNQLGSKVNVNKFIKKKKKKK